MDSNFLKLIDDIIRLRCFKSLFKKHLDNLFHRYLKRVETCGTNKLLNKILMSHLRIGGCVCKKLTQETFLPSVPLIFI
jgi:hypothetical protein